MESNPLIIEDVEKPVRKVLIGQIRKNDTFLAKKICKSHPPNTVVSKFSNNAYTMIHCAAHYNAFKSLLVFVEYVAKNKLDEMKDILNV
mmetsp:Transcript_31265/g.28428  ORF Transcript_31265/g.28428 Transcript_31265/m.28428 type:complete len:89 (+) Transcript_31265:36-302(+)